MAQDMIDHALLTRLNEAGVVSQVSVIAQQGGWTVMIKYGASQAALMAQRSGKVRVFKRFETLAGYLKELGIHRFEVDITDFDPANRGGVTRPDRSEALKRAHEAAAFDEATYEAWFRKQVQDSLDDPRPTIAHEDVKAYFAARKAVLRFKESD
jgi:hypothetical protein